MQFSVRTLLIAEPSEDQSDDDDDGIQIGWPVAIMINATAGILVVVLIAKWVGCR